MDFKSYYYNAGFYIGIGTIVFCLTAIFIFISFGMKSLNEKILENIPNKKKLIEVLKDQIQKRKYLTLFTNRFPEQPPKRKRSKNINKDSTSSDNLKNDKEEKITIKKS